MLDIQWTAPYRINLTNQWAREWRIPNDSVNGFFEFWKQHKFKMLSDGFTVTKRYSDWILIETKPTREAFGAIAITAPPVFRPTMPLVKFDLPSYNIKNNNGLRPWQAGAAGQVVSAINQWGSAVDGSELGTGKTYSACGVIRELNFPFVVVCPKPVINQWEKVIHNHFKLDKNFKGIINYELLIRGRKDSNIASYILSRKDKRKRFTWKIPKDTIIIWDEAHRLKNYTTKASKTCIAAYDQGYKQLFLSATIATSPLELRTLGICTKLFKKSEYYDWVRGHGVYDGMWGMEFDNNPEALKNIHTYLFDQRGVRLQRDVIPNFPETEIIVNAYNMGDEDTKKIREIYDEMKKELTVLKNKVGDSEMAIRIRALQKTEMLKIPLMEEMIREGNEAGMSVVVFLNYSDSIDALATRLGTTCIYDGRNEKTRQKNLNRFQENIEKNLIANLAAAREGINMGDEMGGHPRLSIISPTYSVTKLKQVLGRVNRENSKTKSIQKIIYISNTQEERLVDSVGLKLENLTLINNGIITDNDLKI